MRLNVPASDTSEPDPKKKAPCKSEANNEAPTPLPDTSATTATQLSDGPRIRS